MTEILVFFGPQPAGDATWLATHPQPGDVVVDRPDGWGWTVNEQTMPIFRILKLPNCSDADMAQLMAPEQPADPENPGLLQFRGFYLDPAKMTGDITTYWSDVSRQSPAISLAYMASDIAGVTSQRLPISG